MCSADKGGTKMLNIIKMKEKWKDNECWNTYDFNIFIYQLEKYLEEIMNRAKMTLIERLDVVSVLISMEEYFDDYNKWISIIHNHLVVIRNTLYETYLPVSSFYGLTYICYIVQAISNRIPNLRNFADSLNFFLIQRIDEELKDYEKKECKTNKDFELIGGLSGVLRYLIEFCPEENITKSIIEYFKRRSTSKSIDHFSIPGWSYFPTENEKVFMEHITDNWYINYGISHGMAGPLAVLSIVSISNIANTQSLINTILEEYSRAKFHCHGIVFWPGRISVEEYINMQNSINIPGRMSWCYGNVGILRSIFLASKAVKNEVLKNYVIKELEKIARLDLKFYNVDLPIVCHGWAGIALIMKKMYDDTAIEVFRRKSEIICGKLIDEFIKMNNDLVKSIDYLEGYSGILQVIVSFLDNKVNLNEKRLLMI